MGWYGIEFLVNLFEIFLFADFIQRNHVSHVNRYFKAAVIIFVSIFMLGINVIGEGNVLVAQFTFIFAFIALFMTSKLLMKHSLKQSLVSIIQFFVILLLSDIITIAVMSTFSDVNIAEIMAKSSDRIIAMVLSKTITLYLIRVFNSFRSQDVYESKTHVVLMYTGLLAINTTLSVTMLYLFKWSKGHQFDDLYVFLGSAGIIGVNFFIIFFTNYLIDANRKEKDNLRLQQQNFYYEKYISDVEASRDAFHKLHHNYKHDIQCISGLTVQKEYNKLDDYLSSIDEKLKETEFIDYSCPVPLNALLNAKKDAAVREEIMLDLSVFMPVETIIDDYDLCNIIGNILDNGIEACNKLVESNKELNLSIYIQKKMLFIESTNPIEANLIYDKNKIVTTKRDKTFHGYGLGIIEEIAHKYGGYSSISTENQKFSILVGIPFK